MSKLDFHKAFDVQNRVDCGPTIFADVLGLSWCVILTIKITIMTQESKKTYAFTDEQIQELKNMMENNCLLCKGSTVHIQNGQYVAHQSITVNNGGTLNLIAPQDNGPAVTAPIIRKDSAILAVDELLEALDDEGNYLFTDPNQWYAVYRVLNEYANYPAKMTDFTRVMQEKGYGNERVALSYDSMRYVSKKLSKLACRCDCWNQYSNLSDAYQKQYVITDFLIKRLMN